MMKNKEFDCLALENWPYYKINREERNLVAILYHLLLSSNDNVNKFLEYCDPANKSIDANKVEIEIYFEYSFLRDFWSRFSAKKFNEQKETFIRERLCNGSTDTEKGKKFNALLNSLIGEGQSKTDYEKNFNNFFCARGSTESIESPSNWSMNKFMEKLCQNHTGIANEPELFLRICMLAWSFNIKPDLVLLWKLNDVIHGICIEAKLESDEDKYPADKKNFTRILGDFRNNYLKKSERNDKLFVTQTSLQKFMFNEVLGFQNMQYCMISKKGPLKWDNLPLFLDNCNPKEKNNFVNKYLEQNEKWKK